MRYTNAALALLLAGFIGMLPARAADAPAAAEAAPPIASAPAVAAAADAAKPGELKGPDPDTIPVLKLFKGQGATIVFLGNDLGLNGWFVYKGSQVQVVYTTPDGNGTVTGLLYAPDGELQTTKQLVAANQRGVKLPDLNGNPQIATPGATPAGIQNITGGGPDGAPSERLWKEVSESTYFSYGDPSAPALYVFMDPRCHYCSSYFTTLASAFIPQKAVQLRVIPVAILGPESTAVSVKILSSDNPTAAWETVEHGGSPPSADAKPGVSQKLDANAKIMAEWRLSGTPGSVYRGKDGKVKLVYGLPQDIPQLIADMGH